MRRYDVPVAPLILGVILGPLMEAQFRRALSISQGDATIFLRRPLSAGILAVALLAALVPHIPRLLAAVRGRRADRLVLGEGAED